MRLKRVIDPAGVSVICALDHGMTSPTFLEPLADIERAHRRGRRRRGERDHDEQGHDPAWPSAAFSPTTSLALLLSASAATRRRPAPRSSRSPRSRRRCSLGADAVVLFTALGGDTEAAMIDILAGGRRASAPPSGMPFIAEAEFPTTYAAVEELKQQYGFEYLRRNVRLCAELGADIVKTNWPGDQDSFARWSRRRPAIPLVLAGGSRLEDAELLQRMEPAMAAGAIGCSVGRNIFMHRSPRRSPGPSPGSSGSGGPRTRPCAAHERTEDA